MPPAPALLARSLAAPEPSPSPSPSTEAVVEGATSFLTILVAVAAALVLALVVAEVAKAVTRAVGRGRPTATHLAARARRPLRTVLAVVFSWLAVRLVVDDPPWRAGAEHVFLIATIVAVTWLLGALVGVAAETALGRYRTDVPDNRRARKVRTQVMVLRRLTVAVLTVCAIAGVLMTFEGARAAGAGILASAGLLSVVAGLAAQSSLANVFAGLQLAFTDAIRVDDVVIVEGEWGRIEEITLTYVVVHVWDDRRLILPSTWFTTTPFQNWTRKAADLLGTVEIDVDWEVPVPAMRAELTRLLEASDLWDRRVGVLQVTDATNGLVRVRALASAKDAPTLFDLRCAVREGLVDWLRRAHPESLPRTRWEVGTTAGPLAQPRLPDEAADARGADADAGTGAQPGAEPGAGAGPLEDGQRAPGGTGTDDAQDATTPTRRRRSRDDAPSHGPAPGPEASPGRPSVTEPAADPERTVVLPAVAAHDQGAVPTESDAGGEPGPRPSGEHPTTVRRRSISEARTIAPRRVDVDPTSRLFTGSLDGVRRSQAFTGPSDDAPDDDLRGERGERADPRRTTTGPDAPGE
ncbi:mechanosensitive ion channel family protein [Cellulomonas carbonis]|nr:mechanosensitive ion channel family protein [Cellulomonas carbonis]GGC16840.1 hypothetical protein GCM10010972_32680 [Cellulomonas carbonis]